jgi:CheY-like chemotaxis protein
LSQVYGFVKQSGGHVKIYSELHHGTTVKIYLPRFTGDSDTDALAEQKQLPARGGEPVLVVEDEPDVRAYSCETMRELGYTVFEAVDGEAALRILDERPEIKLLFTDVGLPGRLNGRQLADEAKRRRPALRVLFTTGYARNAIVHGGRLDPGVQLITKPFTYEALATKLRELLDAHRPACRVLLVEDEVLIQMMAVEHLEQAGIQVEVSSTAADALQRLRLMQGEVDVAVVDVGLPDRKGDVLASEMRSLYPDIAVLFATGASGEELRLRFKDDARVTFIGKPYMPDALLDRIRQLCDARSGARKS